ncbi:3-deoxy-manno-octulosonate cytidylyltransferase [Salinivibrio kushneri]|uniref:3-deoxy-manno-octulosonate cytidylyltransferase n=1 Tax=Salinivibrio kushneri TaxID=1908198 RepID=UPI000C847D32|nr:3-deoxy-manno-octulosonate cytidylyltransferase [Salinivibrio kushneri]
MTEVHYIIPARFSSSRLPGKLLLDLAGEPLIGQTIKRAQAVSPSVTVATDHDGIFGIAEQYGATAVMTSHMHNSGTDRLAEAVTVLGLSDQDIVVNLQGDEPLMPAELLNQVADLLLEHPDAAVATLMQRIDAGQDLRNPNIVKVALGENNRALYFSRAPIPFPRDEQIDTLADLPNETYYRHIGLYAYRVSALKTITQLPEHPLEALEKLEQLRPLANNMPIVIAEAQVSPEHGVDTLQDLERVRGLFRS